MLVSRAAIAQPTGAPPADPEALVAHPATGHAAPVIESLDGTSIAISAGGQISTGNSQLIAGTASGEYETRFSNNGVGVSLLGNYGRGAQPGERDETTAQNVQGRLRYDRYLLDRLSVFVLNTGRHDRFQGLDFRYNLDPGVKYLFVQEPTTKFWGELGYDFQYDIRRNDSRDVTGDDGVVLERLDKTAVDHSTRAFVGFNHAFNDEVTFTTGLEYLQSVVVSTQYRVNYEALLAAKLWGGLALGVGFSARYDHAPLPDKKQLDTQTVLSVIYAYSSTAKPAKPPAPEPCPPCPTVAPAPAPAPIPAPESAPAPTTPPPVDTMTPPPEAIEAAPTPAPTP